MPSVQHLLFPDPRPLVERLGRDFFRQLPECPGVYLMRDESGAILYIGKAKCLRKRLGSYRVANPDRMARRHLRLLRSVAQIELQECADEAAALARESELLRTFRPKFNRAGTWPAPPRYFAWRVVGQNLEFTVNETIDPEWRTYGPLGRGAFTLRAVLVRVLWLALHPEIGFSGLPTGWFEGRTDPTINMECGDNLEETRRQLEGFLSGRVGEFCNWIRARVATTNLFETQAMETDLEFLAEPALRSKLFGRYPRIAQTDVDAAPDRLILLRHLLSPMGRVRNKPSVLAVHDEVQDLQGNLSE